VLFVFPQHIDNYRAVLQKKALSFFFFLPEVIFNCIQVMYVMQVKKFPNVGTVVYRFGLVEMFIFSVLS